MNLDDLHAAYARRSDAPDYLLSVVADKPAIVPKQLDIAYDFPIEEEERYATSITTLGLATYSVDDSDERAELVLDVIDERTKKENDLLGNALAALIWTRLQAGLYFKPNTIIRNTTLPLFEDMSALFILDWGHTDPEWLPDIKPPVRLLQVVPLYASEADALEQIKAETRTVVFVQARGNWDEPDRDPVPLLAQATRNVWARIEKWYRQNAPVVHEKLREGASEEEIRQLETKLGVPLPEDFKASLLTHNGAVGFHSYEYLTTDRIHKIWSMTNKTEKGKSKWDRHFIPFAKDSGGNLLCLDLSPSKEGATSRVIYWERDQGPLPSEHSSFFEWLWSYQQGLYRKQYFVDEEGLIRETV